MPFSTYLRDPDPPPAHDRDAQSQAQYPTTVPSNAYDGQLYVHPHEQGQYIYGAGMSVKDYASGIGAGGYYAYGHPHLTSLATDTTKTSGPPSHASPDSLFQMPAFLLDGFGGTLAPGGGAEVLPPGGTFHGAAPAFAFGAGCGAMLDKPWQTTKYYRREAEGHMRIALSSPAPVPPPSPHDSQVASPFGYLHAEPPKEQNTTAAEPNASASPSVAHEAVMEGSDDATANVAVERSLSPSVLEQVPDNLSAITPERTEHATEHALYAPSPSSGLPVYSQSGFDMLAVLGRVATRPSPSIALGPVDLTCAFVVADVRRADAPIVYASRTFCDLTGYTEGEVLGRNCRFLQAPGGRVSRGDVRRFTSPDAVRALRFALQADREVQVSLINYRKDGRPFVNRVSIVPVPAASGTGEIAFHVGFQVDLNEQPTHIMQRMKEGKFYSSVAGGVPFDALQALTPAERSAKGMGKVLRALLTDKTFQAAITLTTSFNAPPPASSSASSIATGTSASDASSSASGPGGGSVGGYQPDARDERQWLHLLLLEHAPDFVHVLSLKGHFLYVSPSVRRVLGYEPGELVGRGVGDFCHPSDAVPLLRELKESSLTPGQQQQVATAAAENENTASDGSDATQTQSQTQSNTQTQMQQPSQRTVDLLFRMRTKGGAYEWVECLGRLHVEPGKGRKAIVLSGRACPLPSLRWGAVARAGGLVGPAPMAASGPAVECYEMEEVGAGEDGAELDDEKRNDEREFWAMLCNDGLFLVAGTAVRDVLGWGTGEVIGRAVREFIVDDGGGEASQVLAALGRAAAGSGSGANAGEDGTQHLSCRMKKRDGEAVWMQVVLYGSDEGATQEVASPTLSTRRIVAQFKLLFSLPVPISPDSHSPLSSFSTYSPNSYSASTSYIPHPQHANDLSPVAPLPNEPGRILRAPNVNVFAELEVQRGTSWQYELQQLKNVNQKLREEVELFEVRQRQRRAAQGRASVGRGL